MYQQALDQARHWHGLMDVLIKRADREDKESNKAVNEALNINSVAEELKKLAELRDIGVLSEEEFQRQKSRTLNT